jgi:hypothetical protein
MQSEAEPDTPNPHTERETGLNNLSRGPGDTAHRGPSSGTRRDVRARPTQGRVIDLQRETEEKARLCRYIDSTKLWRDQQYEAFWRETRERVLTGCCSAPTATIFGLRIIAFSFHAYTRSGEHLI